MSTRLGSRPPPWPQGQPHQRRHQPRQHQPSLLETRLAARRVRPQQSASTSRSPRAVDKPTDPGSASPWWSLSSPTADLAPAPRPRPPPPSGRCCP